MNRLNHFIMKNKIKLQEHPFYKLVSSDSIPIHNKLFFAPIMAHLIMNFRDMNKWVIRFDDDFNQYRKTINGGTIEDETHSRLFLEDWRKLHLDDELKWESSDLIYWLFLSEDMECFRQFGVEFMKLCVDDDACEIYRFAHSETGETCGNVFFSIMSPIAEDVALKKGILLRYFGDFHLQLENGHVWQSEDIFHKIELSDEELEKSIAFSKRMFDIFEGIHDAFFQYTSQYVLNDGIPAIPRSVPSVECQPVDMLIPELKNGSVFNSRLFSHINYYLERASQHPFFDWLCHHDLDPFLKIKSFSTLDC